MGSKKKKEYEGDFGREFEQFQKLMYIAHNSSLEKLRLVDRIATKAMIMATVVTFRDPLCEAMWIVIGVLRPL